MNKKKILIYAAILAVAGWLGWKWWQKRKAAAGEVAPVIAAGPGANAKAAGA